MIISCVGLQAIKILLSSVVVFRSSHSDRVTESTTIRVMTVFLLRWWEAGAALYDFYICYVGGRMFSHMMKMFTIASQEKCQNLKDLPVG